METESEGKESGKYRKKEGNKKQWGEKIGK